MRVTRILNRQHIDRMFKKHWLVQGQRVVIESGIEHDLKMQGLPVYNPQDILKEQNKRVNLNIIGIKPKAPVLDSTHPNWHDDVCYFYRDNNVLLLGIDQAKVLTNTVGIKGLPESIENFPSPTKAVSNKVLKTVLSSYVFDTQQEKLEKIKDPDRPAWNFPRQYGVTNSRINQIVTSKLLQLCENSEGGKSFKKHMVLTNGHFCIPLTKAGDLIQLELSAEQILMSSEPLKPIGTSNAMVEAELPNLSPIEHTITLVPEHIYEIRNIYPFKKNTLPNKYHPHTVVVHFDKLKVQNLYEEKITESQILGRTLMKAFTVGSSYARFKFGKNVSILPEPVMLQCIQTDGKFYHFGLLQLNTLNLDDEIRNIWYSIPKLELFSSLGSYNGKPTVENYNPDVIRYLLAFYYNV